jgi:hypothetical protein
MPDKKLLCHRNLLVEPKTFLIFFFAAAADIPADFSQSSGKDLG